MTVQVHQLIAERLTRALVRLSPADGGVPLPTPTKPGLDFAEAIAWHRKRDRALTKKDWLALGERERQQAFTVANVAQLDVIADVHRAIGKALEEGTTLADFKAETKEQLLRAWGGTVKNPAARLETIFRTNVQVAYGAGAYQQALRATKTHPFWRLDVVLDGRTSTVCRPVAGIVLPAEDPWWKTNVPPRHFNCRARLTPMRRSAAERAIEARRGQGLPVAPPADAQAQTGFGTPFDEWTPALTKYPPELQEPARKRVAKKRKPATKALGTPVSEAVETKGIRGLTKEAKAALKAIDEVHGDGVLPKVKVLTRSAVKFNGAYRYNPKTGDPVDIILRRPGDWPSLTLVHETGHFLDHKALGKDGKFATAEADQQLAKWRTAVEASEAFKRLQELRTKDLVEWETPEGEKRSIRISHAHVEYLLNVKELWARSYAQYIAHRSTSADLKAELATSIGFGRISYPYQWEPEDFEPIADAFDELFKELGWRQ